jgi:hypothetical protein
MLTGEPPFTGPTAQAIIAKRFVAPIPKIRVTRDVPEGVDQAVSRALARTPVDRYPTAAEFAEALRELTRDAGSGAPRTPPEAQRGAAPAKAIAVIPLANMSADPEYEYFPPGGRALGRGDRGDAEGPDPRSAVGPFQPLARPVPAVLPGLRGRHRAKPQDHRRGRGVRPGVPRHRLGAPRPGTARRGPRVVSSGAGAGVERPIVRRLHRAGARGTGSAG